jgi:hypothetical protein
MCDLIVVSYDKRCLNPCLDTRTRSLAGVAFEQTTYIHNYYVSELLLNVTTGDDSKSP